MTQFCDIFGIGVYEMGAVPTGSVTEKRFRGHTVFGAAKHSRILLNPMTSINIHKVLPHRGMFYGDVNSAVQRRAVFMCVAIVSF